MKILDQIRPYLQPVEYLEAIEVLFDNGIEKYEASTAELAFFILWSYDPAGNWQKRYANALRLRNLDQTINQPKANQAARAVSDSLQNQNQR